MNQTPEYKMSQQTQWNPDKVDPNSISEGCRLLTIAEAQLYSSRSAKHPRLQIWKRKGGWGLWHAGRVLNFTFQTDLPTP